MNEGQRRKKKLWNEQGRAEMEKLPLAPWASRLRQDLLELLDRMNPTIEALTRAVEQEAKKPLTFFVCDEFVDFRQKTDLLVRRLEGRISAVTEHVLLPR